MLAPADGACCSSPESANAATVDMSHARNTQLVSRQAETIFAHVLHFLSSFTTQPLRVDPCAVDTRRQYFKFPRVLRDTHLHLALELQSAVLPMLIASSRITCRLMALRIATTSEARCSNPVSDVPAVMFASTVTAKNISDFLETCEFYSFCTRIPLCCLFFEPSCSSHSTDQRCGITLRSDEMLLHQHLH